MTTYVLELNVFGEGSQNIATDLKIASYLFCAIFVIINKICFNKNVTIGVH